LSLLELLSAYLITCNHLLNCLTVLLLVRKLFLILVNISNSFWSNLYSDAGFGRIYSIYFIDNYALIISFTSFFSLWYVSSYGRSVSLLTFSTLYSICFYNFLWKGYGVLPYSTNSDLVTLFLGNINSLLLLNSFVLAYAS